MAVYIAKPPTAIRQATRMPAGCKAYYALTERTGGVVRDATGNGYHGTLAGTCSLAPGPMGPQLGGFGYTAINGVAPTIGAAPPWWVAALFANTSSAAGSAIGFGGSAANPLLDLRFNLSATNNLHYVARDDAGITMAAGVNNPACTDGLPHVLMGITRTANRHEIWLDGRLIANSLTAIGGITFTLADLGNRPTGDGHFSPFFGTLSAAAVGVGAIPDPWNLAQDWLSGRFAAVRMPEDHIPAVAASAYGGSGRAGGGVIIGSPIIRSIRGNA